MGEAYVIDGRASQLKGRGQVAVGPQGQLPQGWCLLRLMCAMLASATKPLTGPESLIPRLPSLEQTDSLLSFALKTAEKFSHWPAGERHPKAGAGSIFKRRGRCGQRKEMSSQTQ